jgi:biopolymer transport protein ExbD
MNDRPFETINVVPFIDIMLVLLAIVLTTANFIVTGRIPVSLPEASPTKIEKHQDKTIDLPVDGTIYFDGALVSADALASRVGALPPDTSFLIRADRNLAFQKFIDIADMLKRLNFIRVAVQTRSLGR